jgi:two-component system response regulator MprA
VWSYSGVSRAQTKRLLAWAETFLKHRAFGPKLPPSSADDSALVVNPGPVVIVIEVDYALARSLERSLTSVGQRVERLFATDDVLLPRADADVLLLTVADGLGTVRRLRGSICAPIVLILAEAGLADRIAGLDAGADLVLPAAFEVDELLAQMRALQRGRALALAHAFESSRQGFLAYADLCVDQDSRRATRGRRRLALRPKSYDLLAHFVRHPERVHSRAELLRSVWGFEFVGEGDSNVIDVTVSQLRRALETEGEPRLIHTVRPLGYILRAA